MDNKAISNIEQFQQEVTTEIQLESLQPMRELIDAELFMIGGGSGDVVLG